MPTVQSWSALAGSSSLALWQALFQPLDKLLYDSMSKMSPGWQDLAGTVGTGSFVDEGSAIKSIIGVLLVVSLSLLLESAIISIKLVSKFLWSDSSHIVQEGSSLQNNRGNEAKDEDVVDSPVDIVSPKSEATCKAPGKKELGDSSGQEDVTPLLAYLPTPSRASAVSTCVRVKKDPIQQAELLLQEPELSCEISDFSIPEDEEWDDSAFHQRRSQALGVFIAAYRILAALVETLQNEVRLLNCAGVNLQDEVERLQKENRDLEGEVAYWHELAAGHEDTSLNSDVASME